MRQGPNSRRSRGRGNPGGGQQGGGGGHQAPRRQNIPLRHQTFESNGPEGRIRGTAFQVYERYQALARDAQSSGDRVAAENLYQHAEHYFRIIGQINEQEARQRAPDHGGRHGTNGHGPYANGNGSYDDADQDDGTEVIGSEDDREPVGA